MNNKNLMCKFNLIGITGRKFNGKDTLGQYFVSYLDYERLGFADALKEACRCIFGFNDDQLYGDKKEIVDEFWKVTPRKIFQYVGTDLFRDQLKNIIPHVESSIWIEVLKKQILDKRNANPDVKIVITDVRFSNEVDMIHQLGGIVLRVNRDIMNTEIDQHPSEMEIEKLNIDYEIPNNGSIHDLYSLVISKIFK